MAEKAESKVVPLLVLLAILGGAGAWNYKRNAEAEAAEPNPYRSYSEADLHKLIDAYTGVIERQKGRYQAHKAGGVVVHDRAHLGAKVDEFERIQHISAKTRALAGQVTDSEIAKAHIEAELARRDADRPIYKVYVRRLFTFRPI